MKLETSRADSETDIKQNRSLGRVKTGSAGEFMDGMRAQPIGMNRDFVAASSS
jgi:hypothetical protein